MAKKKTNSKEIGLFDIVKWVFTDLDTIMGLSDVLLKRHSYMVNRFMSIQYPQQAYVFHLSGVSGSNIVRAWASFFSRQRLRYSPKWIYTKGAKRSKEEVNDKSEFNMKDIKEMCAYNKIVFTDYEANLKFFPDKVKSDLRQYKELMEQIKNPVSK